VSRTAVVFGATGLVGNELVDELLGNDTYTRVITVTRRGMPFSSPKLEQILLQDFSELMQQKDKLHATDFFCCIGTTIKTAGSKEAFLQVDLDIPVQIAKLAQALVIPNLVVISSVGANALARNFYLQTKGKMEDAVRNAYSGNLKFVRPSLLMGNRAEYRLGEKFAIGFMKTFGWVFIGPMKRYRGIYTRDVAKAMIRVAQSTSEKVVYESDEL
jgi:uncharacterized protein YbjT (DUF2867 family)